MTGGSDRDHHCWQEALQGETTPEAEAHVADCAVCQRLLRALQPMTRVRDEGISPPPPGLDERVLERVREQLTVGAMPEAGGRLPRRGGLPERLGAVRRRPLLPVAALTPVLGLLFVLLTLGTGTQAAAFTSQCDRLAEDEILVAGPWKGTEQERFEEVLDRFEESTGASVAYRHYQDAGQDPREIATTIEKRISAGCPPDVALLPQPGLLKDLARRGHLKAIDEVAGKLVKENYRRFWRDLAIARGRGTDERALYGVWFKATNKSTIWYSRSLFARAGVRPPRTWEELLRVARRLEAQGIAPLSVAGRDGWTLTDWFENVYLRTAGPERYDELAVHDRPWTDETVRRALSRLSELVGRSQWLAGGTEGALQTRYEDSVRHVFGASPRAAMVFEGDFMANQIVGSTEAEIGRDAAAFPFPAVDGSAPGVIAGGDVAVLLTANHSAKELIRFLATPQAAEPWAEAGGFISPNTKVDLAAYPDEIRRGLAKGLMGARNIRFDLSDQQPPAFGAIPEQGMRRYFRDYLANPRDVDHVDAITQQLARGATAAQQCEKANAGQC